MWLLEERENYVATKDFILGYNITHNKKVDHTLKHLYKIKLSSLSEIVAYVLKRQWVSKFICLLEVYLEYLSNS